MSEVVSVRVSAEEKELAEKLGLYLHKLGKIDQPSVSSVLRLALRFTANEIIKAIEAERYSGEP